MAITPTEAQRYASIPTHAQAQQHLFESVTPIFAMAVGRVRRLRTLRLVRIRAIQGNGGGSLMQPRRREGIDLQGLECDGTIDLVEIRGKPGLEDVPQQVSSEGGT